MDENWVIVASFQNIAEAHLAKSALAQKGIESLLFDEFMGTQFTLGIGLSLRVPTGDAQKARKILSNADQPCRVIDFHR